MGSRGRFIVIVGSDGVGKTTVAGAICSRLGDDGAYVHFLPRPPYRLAARPPEVPGQLEKDRSGGSRVTGILRLGRSVLRSWLGYYRAIRPALRRGVTVVGDRWLYGYLAQPLSLRFYGPRWVARLALALTPSPDLVVLLEAPFDVINARKSELTRDEVEREFEVWRDTVPKALRLDATQPPDVLAAAVLTRNNLGTRFKAYPPGLGHVLVPAAPRKAALDGSSLYTPARRRGVMLHRASRVLLRTVGTAWLTSVPGEDMPLQREDWSAFHASLVAGGIPADSVAFHGRTQVHRLSFSLITIGSEGVTAFVRVADGAALDAESRSIAMLEKFGPASFVHPRILLRGSVGAIEYAAYSPVLSGFHGPPRNPKIGPVIADIQEALADLPKPPGTPSHWVPMHGDFTPWNLREFQGELVLIDWESCGWGPPHADEVLYIAASRVLGLRTPDGVRTDEAAEFWRDRLGRSLQGRDDRLKTAVAKELSITES